MKKSKSMPELISHNVNDNNSVSSSDISDTDSMSSGDILDIDNMKEATEIVLPKVQEKGILSFLFGV